eukprot:COSAG06_NODE_1571_length_9064_cov_22.348689_5_plen_91_part_00
MAPSRSYLLRVTGSSIYQDRLGTTDRERKTDQDTTLVKQHVPKIRSKQFRPSTFGSPALRSRSVASDGITFAQLIVLSGDSADSFIGGFS